MTPSIVTLNAGGIPWLKRKRAKRIRKLVKSRPYALACFQELWAPWDPWRVRPKGYHLTRGRSLSGLAILSRERPLEVRHLTYRATSLPKFDFLARKGLRRVYLRDWPRNRGYKYPESVVRVDSLTQVAERLVQNG